MIPPQRNADFAAGMERVLDVYRRPYDADFPVVCMDETPRQLIGETRTPVPPAPGRPAREDYEYRRLGTCNVFMATEPLAGRRQTKVTERRTKTDWARFLRDIAAQYPDATRITLVMDNLNTHRPGALYETFEPAEAKALWDRFEFVHTPTHGSWLNVAEVELNVMISASASTAASIPSTPRAPKSPPGRRPETESKRRSTGSSPRTTPVSSSSASIRRLMCDMTLVLGDEVKRVAMLGGGRADRHVRRVAVRVKGHGSPVSLQSLGDGAVRLFGIAMFLANAGDGFLLIDEAENGIHHSVQAAMWEMVLRTAHRDGAQVLATTHSWDCVRGFAKAAGSTGLDGLLVRLEGANGRLRAVEYDGEDLAVAAEQGIEVR